MQLTTSLYSDKSTTLTSHIKCLANLVQQAGFYDSIMRHYEFLSDILYHKVQDGQTLPEQTSPPFSWIPSPTSLVP